ncbi:MAG TPA: nucleotidyltransferase domain-containing protein [Pseudonocardiaceae bacterium]|jgi:predicted nucleotidyltransferase|nr:nucleotidyltransferase domain-containing protein [Pseudonocardiaceae bacterium]
MELSRPLSTVTPTLDGDVLAVLARSDAAFTTGQLHRILTRKSEEGIRKVLQRLVKQGVVHSGRVGNAFTYRLNRDHLAAEHILGLAALREKLFKRIEDRLKSWQPPPVYAAVFGSAAGGSMTADSDLDLLLVRPDDTDDSWWEKQVNDLIAEVTRWTGNDTRPLEFTASELAARGRDEPVLRAVLDEGLTVAGTRSWLNKQLRQG